MMYSCILTDIDSPGGWLANERSLAGFRQYIADKFDCAAIWDQKLRGVAFDLRFSLASPTEIIETGLLSLCPLTVT